MNTTRPTTAGLAALAALALAAGAWYLAANSDRPGDDAVLLAASQPGFVTRPASLGAPDAPMASASGHATREVGGQPTDPFLNAGLKQTIEAMVLEANAAGDTQDPAVLKKRLVALVARFFPAAYNARATALVERYVDYRVAASDLKAPSDPSDPRSLRSALTARQTLRETYFTADEYAALFAQDAQLDRFTLARLEIERNSALSAAQKHAALQDAELGLGDAQRAARAAAVAHVAVAAQTTAFDARGTTDLDRYTARSAQYGDAAATQLAQLDRENRSWQGRLNDYVSTQAKKASPDELQQLRQQLFSAPEQLRIEAALAARLPGGAVN